MIINIVFCFDENLQRQVQVAIASLLDNRTEQNVHFGIYCVCIGNMQALQDQLQMLVDKRDNRSKLHFLQVENPYAGSYQVRGISAGTYLRLALPELLPDLDRILYTDVDVLFRGDISKIWELDLDGKLIAGVRGAVNLSDKWEWNRTRTYWKDLEEVKGSYINAGVTMLNLNEMRLRKLPQQWRNMAGQKFYYQDQDILNLSCKGKVAFLSPVYNSMAYMTAEDFGQFVTEGIYTQEEANAAYENPIILHYAGDKPWKCYHTNHGSLWWDYVNSQDDLQQLFDEAAARKYHGPGIWERIIRKIKKIFSREKL